MQGSIVTTGTIKNAQRAGQPEPLAFKVAEMVSGRTAAGQAVPVYALSQASNPAAGFQAYICDYEQGKTRYLTLGQNADFMFTVTMNGCTFATGMAAANGDVLVCHSNTSKGFGSKTPPELQAQMQRLQVEQLISQGGLILEPANYRVMGKEQSTTFGIRRNGAWEFWMHTYTYSGNQTFTAGATTRINGPQFALEPSWQI